MPCVYDEDSPKCLTPEQLTEFRRYLKCVIMKKKTDGNIKIIAKCVIKSQVFEVKEIHLFSVGKNTRKTY